MHRFLVFLSVGLSKLLNCNEFRVVKFFFSFTFNLIINYLFFFSSGNIIQITKFYFPKIKLYGFACRVGRSLFILQIQDPFDVASHLKLYNRKNSCHQNDCRFVYSNGITSNGFVIFFVMLPKGALQIVEAFKHFAFNDLCNLNAKKRPGFLDIF